jgi:DNA-3-methyladenine glycosylase
VPTTSPRPAAIRLSREFYERPTLVVAEALLGKVLVHHTPAGTRVAGAIVETEAYIGESDPACHAAPGPTPRNAPLYGPPGIAYVYLNYGIHYLLNAVTEGEGHPAAVLLRAIAPVEGIGVMRRRRDVRAGTPVDALGRGPGNLARALGVTLRHNRSDRGEGALTIEDHGLQLGPVAWGPRIGIRVGVDRPWRCWVAGHPAVSGPRSRARGAGTIGS